MTKTDTSFPDVVRIEVTGLCNFKCIHCPTGTNPNNRNHLSFENFNTIINQFRNSNFIPRVVVLYHGGEPLLNQNLSKYITLLKDYGVSKTVITTNASLLTKEKAHELIIAGLDEMKVSFDGKDPLENDSIRINGNFNKHAYNVLRLLKIRDSLGSATPVVKVSNVQIYNKTTLLYSIENKKSLYNAPQYLKDFFKEIQNGIEFYSYPAMVWPGYKKSDNFQELKLNNEKPSYCSALFETFTILSNGNIVPCCYDLNADAVLGNIFENSFQKIWNGKLHSHFRKNFQKQEYPEICKRCLHVNQRYLYKNEPINE